MNNYRLYRIDGAGRISTAEWLEAADDDAAREQAILLCANGASVELWARNRLVVRLTSADVAQAATEAVAIPPDIHGGPDRSSPAH